MASAWLAVALACCGVLGLQAQENEGDFSPDQTTTPADQLSVLQQLAARVEKLEEECNSTGRSRVAFSASLVTQHVFTHYGPYEQDSPLVFKKVTTNIGEAYDPESGVFTAPLRGVYYIRFTGCVGSSGSINAALLKNGENMFAIYSTVGYHTAAANGMTLLLEQGDRLWVVLWPNTSIFDQSRLSTFSGFLLFPM